MTTRNTIESSGLTNASRTFRSLLFTLVFALVIVCSTIALTALPSSFHTVTTIPLVYALGILAIRRIPVIRIPKYALVAYTAIWLIYIPHALWPTVETFAMVRIPVFMGGMFIVLFLVPQSVSLEFFFRSVFYFAGILALLGIPTAIFGSYTFLGVPIYGYEATAHLPVFDVTIRPVKSILNNPNPFGIITGMGFIAGLPLVLKTPNKRDELLLALIFVSVVLSSNRSSILGLATSIIVFASFYRWGKLGAAVSIGLGLGFASTLLAARIGLIPDLFSIQQITFSSRIQLWTAALDLLRQNLLFGIGFQSLAEAISSYLPPRLANRHLHNTYLFVLTTRGIVGGAIHFLLLVVAYRQRLVELQDQRTAALLCMYTFLLIVMMFESIQPFGFSVLSILAGLVLGYSLLPSETVQQGYIDSRSQ